MGSQLLPVSNQVNWLGSPKNWTEELNWTENAFYWRSAKWQEFRTETWAIQLGLKVTLVGRCVLPLCSGDGVSLGSSDRKTPTSSRALVTTGSLALKSLLKPWDNTHKQAHTHLKIRVCFNCFHLAPLLFPLGYYCQQEPFQQEQLLHPLFVVQTRTFLPLSIFFFFNI